MNYCKSLFIVFIFIPACTPGSDQVNQVNESILNQEIDQSHFFDGIDPDDATFVVLDGQNGTITRYNTARDSLQFKHASTIKIKNTIIALETAIANNKDFTLPYDSLAPRDPGFWSSVWSQDHSLQSAINHSVYWYYQEIARRVGEEQMRHFLEQFNYGNQNMEGGIDRFWLHGGLRISPDEQVRFLKRLYSGESGISEHATAVLKDIIILEETDEYRISGKTGTAEVTPTRELLWLVGYLEKEDRVWFYALNLEGEQAWELWGARANRLGLVRALLTDIGVLD
jgi:beta-lactamase class D